MSDIIKRLFDIICAFFGLLFLFPVLLIVAFFVRQKPRFSGSFPSDQTGQGR